MKDSKLKVKIAILALATMQMASTGITPALAGMAKSFPNESSAVLQMLMSLPALFVVPFALFSGTIVTILPKKTLILIGVICIGVGGLMPAVLNDFTLILIMRILVGIGIGLVMPIAPSVVTDYFTGDERNSVMGLFGAFASFGGIFNALVGGLLANIGWRYNFLVYLTAIPVLIMVLLLLPKDMRAKAERSEKVRIPWKIFYISFFCFVFTTTKFAFTMNISMFMSEEHLGNAAITGFVTSVYTAGGFVAGFIFGRLAKFFRNYTLGVGMLFAATGMFLVFVSGNLAVLFIGAFLLGTALSIVNPRFNILIAETASPKSMALSLAICMAMMNLGQFAAPIAFDVLGTAFGFTTKRNEFMLAAIALLLLGAGSLVANFISNRRKKRDLQPHKPDAGLSGN